jgi:hypothetical protein
MFMAFTRGEGGGNVACGNRPGAAALRRYRRHEHETDWRHGGNCRPLRLVHSGGWTVEFFPAAAGRGGRLLQGGRRPEGMRRQANSSGDLLHPARLSRWLRGTSRCGGGPLHAARISSRLRGGEGSFAGQSRRSRQSRRRALRRLVMRDLPFQVPLPAGRPCRAAGAARTRSASGCDGVPHLHAGSCPFLRTRGFDQAGDGSWGKLTGSARSTETP